MCRSGRDDWTASHVGDVFRFDGHAPVRTPSVLHLEAPPDSLEIVVVHLLRVEIHGSARRHGVPEEDIQHALAHSITWTELGEDPPRYLLVGPDRAGNLLELVVLDVGGDELVIHAMPLRPSTAQELFGDER